MSQEQEHQRLDGEGSAGVSEAPAYARLAELIEAGVLRSEYPPGSRLPSERHLARRYGVGRHTASQALAYLEAKGTVYRKERQGSFVRPFRIEFPLSAGLGIEDVLRRLRLPVSNKILDVRRIGAYGGLVSKMGVPAGEPLVVMKRLRRVGEFPLHHDTSYLREGVFPGVEALLNENHLLARSMLREEYGFEFRDHSLTFETEPADGELAEQLEVHQGATLVRMETILTVEPHGDPAVLGIVFFRGDAVRLRVRP